MDAPVDDVRRSPDTPPVERSNRPPAPAVAAAVAGLVGAWIAAGSTGLVGHPLRRGLAWMALGLIVIAAWPRIEKTAVGMLTLVLAAGVAVAMIATGLPPVGVLAVALVLVAVARGQSGPGRRTILLAAEAVTVLAIYRVACTSIPLVWLVADSIGGGMGRVAGLNTGQSLWVGATFAGVDFLVTMVYLAAAATLRSGWMGRRKPFPYKQLALALLIVLLGQLIYLNVLTSAGSILARFPEVEVQPAGIPGAEEPAPAAFPAKVREWVPWNLPVLAAAMHLVIAWVILRRLTSFPDEKGSPVERTPFGRPLAWAVLAWAVLSAAALAVLTTFCGHRPDLRDKKVVLFEKGFLNWNKPEHGDYGRLSIGMYGMFPTYVESLGARRPVFPEPSAKDLGARCLVSPDLSAEDLRDADALILFYPNEPWEEGQLERIWQFVRRGGTLLVMGEHTVQEEEGGSRINDVLAPTAMRVRFDSAMFTVGGWLQSYEALAHPTTAGISDEKNLFGAVIGASVEARWPARPVLVGRWGWADPGDEESEAAMMGNRRYDPGEKLGDLVLAAEQPLGKGRVIVFGDTSGLTNGLTIGCHPYTSRLVAYLVDGPPSSPQATWRQLAGLVAALMLLALLIWRPAPWCLAAVAVVLGTLLVVFTNDTHHFWEVLPDGNRKSPNNLAYIDSSHMGVYSRESWRSEGLMGLCLTLMRNDYLTLMLPEITSERLSRARLLVSVAPAREFSSREREVLKDFVREGGILICTTGYEERGASRQLLSEFDFHVGQRPAEGEEQVEEPRPLGHFKSPFFNGGDYLAHVRFHAAWPVYCDDADALEVTYHPPDLPVITIRRYGRGLVAVIGDTCFAMNKNLEYESGVPFEGMRENADFWRWFLAMLREGVGEGELWYPPKPEAAAAPDQPSPPETDSTPQETP